MKNTQWITHKERRTGLNQTYYFKKSFDLDKVRDAKIEISAQARYKLYINEKFVCCGPCKGSREKTFFDTVDGVFLQSAHLRLRDADLL